MSTDAALLCEAYRPLIYRQALRVLRDPTECEDATQDVLVKIFRFLPRFENRSKLSTWIHRVTYNVCMNHVAMRRRLQREAGSAERGGTETPDGLLEQRETRSLVLRGLLALPAKYRVPLVLHFYADLPYSAIAERTGMPLNTVKIRIHRGKKLLKAELRSVFDDAAGRARVA